MKLLVVCDESSKIVGHRYLNSQISFYIGIIQFGVCVWATAQHVFSIVRFKKVLHCDFVNGTKPVLLVGVDIIIFDIGLFHSLWDIESCVAQHLDGGYGRFTWCVCHILALLISLPFAFVSRPPPFALWPLLIQQSAYGIGLLILSLSALPRILPIFTGYPNGASLFALAIYILGTGMNSFLLYVYWHWYWHVESMWNSARKLRPNHIVINPNMRSKRTLIKPPPEMLNNMELTVASYTETAAKTPTVATPPPLTKVPATTLNHTAEFNSAIIGSATASKLCLDNKIVLNGTFNNNMKSCCATTTASYLDFYDNNFKNNNYAAINEKDDGCGSENDGYDELKNSSSDSDNTNDDIVSNECCHIFDSSQTVAAVSSNNGILASTYSINNNSKSTVFKAAKNYRFKSWESVKQCHANRQRRQPENKYYRKTKQATASATPRKYKICSNYYEEVLPLSHVYLHRYQRIARNFEKVRKLPTIRDSLYVSTPKDFPSKFRSGYLRPQSCYNENFDKMLEKECTRRLLPMIPYHSFDK